MIAPIEKPRRHDNVPEWHKCLLQMLPTIVRNARHAFKDLPADARHDAIAEVVANCTVAVARLAQRKMLDLAYPTPLSLFAVKQYFAGRRVGNKIASRDVYSQQARDRGGYEVRHLGTPHEQQSGGWREQLVENRRTTPADVACFRLDFPRWLESLSPRDRKIAEALSDGETTGRTARTFGISSGRVSQIRAELRRRWFDFHGELDGVAVAAS
jgi:hypothetical protein